MPDIELPRPRKASPAADPGRQVEKILADRMQEKRLDLWDQYTEAIDATLAGDLDGATVDRLGELARELGRESELAEDVEARRRIHELRQTLAGMPPEAELRAARDTAEAEMGAAVKTHNEAVVARDAAIFAWEQATNGLHRRMETAGKAAHLEHDWPRRAAATPARRT